MKHDNLIKWIEQIERRINGVFSLLKIPNLPKKTALDITDLTDYSIEIGKEDSVNKESYGLLLSQLDLLINKTKYSNLTTKTDDFILTIDNDYIILDSTSKQVNITLPLISTTTHGKSYTFYCIDNSNGSNVICSGLNTILTVGATFGAMNNNDCITVIADNTSGYWLLLYNTI
jgi:hypothetical protein